MAPSQGIWSGGGRVTFWVIYMPYIYLYSWLCRSPANLLLSHTHIENMHMHTWPKWGNYVSNLWRRRPNPPTTTPAFSLQLSHSLIRHCHLQKSPSFETDFSGLLLHTFGIPLCSIPLPPPLHRLFHPFSHHSLALGDFVSISIPFPVSVGEGFCASWLVGWLLFSNKLSCLMLLLKSHGALPEREREPERE